MLDDQVRRAMRKWPQVPAVYGWLRLGRRGQWFLVDRAQEGFDEALHGQGSPITSPPIVDFIGRNYEHDDEGAWYWQNGPQRAYATLELAPLILRVLGDAPAQRLVTHAGYPVQRVLRVMSDDDGNLLMQTDLGPAAVDDRDIAQLLLREGEDGGLELELQRYPEDPGEPRRPWRVRALGARGAAQIGAALGYVAEPRRPAGPPTTTATPSAAPGRPGA
jgi:hypothetical protein